MDPLPVDLKSLIGDCSSESVSHDTGELLVSQSGEYFEHITNEGLTQFGDNCNLKEEECLQVLPPLPATPIQNTVACHPGEEIWDKFEFPNDDTKECVIDIKNDWDAEMCNEPTADIFTKEIYIKEDVMWSEQMVTPGQVEDQPVEELLELELANTPNNLLQQPSLSPCESTVEAGQMSSLFKINQQKGIVSSGNPWTQTLKKNVPTVKYVVPSPNALPAVTPNNSLRLVNCSNTVLTSPRKAHQKSAFLNTEQHLQFEETISLLSATRMRTTMLAEVTSSPISPYSFTATKNMLKANHSKAMVARFPTKSGLENRFLTTNQQHLNRSSSGNPLSTTLMKTQTVKGDAPSQSALHPVSLDNCSATVSTASLNKKQQFHVVNDSSLLSKRVMKTQQVPNMKSAEINTRCMIKNVSVSSGFLMPRNEQTSSASNTENSGECSYLSMASPKVERSKRKRRRVHRAKQYILSDSDEEADLYEKRYIRNSCMKFEREALNKLVQQLRTVVPSTEHNTRASEVMVLQEATKYCREVTHVTEEQQKEIDKLQSQQKKLCQTLSLLRLEMAVNRLRQSLYTGLIKKQQIKSVDTDEEFE